MRKTLVILALVGLMVVSLTGCGNQPPVIDSSTPNGTTYTVEVNCPIDFSVSASDPDGDELTYQWSFTDGSTPFGSGETSSIRWTAPGSTGTAYASVTVSDGKDEVTHSWTITIIPVQIN